MPLRHQCRYGWCVWRNGNVTTCTPDTTVCCASRKTTKNKRLCSMTSKSPARSALPGRTGGEDANRSGQLPRTLQQTVVLSGPNDGGTGPLIACSRRL